MQDVKAVNKILLAYPSYCPIEISQVFQRKVVPEGLRSRGKILIYVGDGSVQ
jgi:hypothetical protein